jgi:hypothetical protein
MAFLQKHTVFRLATPIDLQCERPGQWVDAEVAEQRIEAARRLFGPDGNERGSPATWQLETSQLAAAIAFALDDDKWPRQRLGPTMLHVAYRFSWLNLEADARVAADVARSLWDDGDNLLGVSLGGRKLFLQPTFVFRQPYRSLLLLQFLDGLQNDAPFVLRRQYFRRLTPRKDGLLGRGRLIKLDDGWWPDRLSD